MSTAEKRLPAGPSGPLALPSFPAMNFSNKVQRNLRLGALPRLRTRNHAWMLLIFGVLLCWLVAIWDLSSDIERSSIYLDGNGAPDDNLLGLLKTIQEARALSIPAEESRMALFSAVEKVMTGGRQGIPGQFRTEVDALESKFVSALGGIERDAHVLECDKDSGVLDVELPVDGMVLLSANLHNSEEIMPNFILQLLRAVGRVPQGGMGVSIYESGSTDQTWIWLDALRCLLDFAQVPNNVTYHGDLIRGSVPQNRIGFLAKVRNAVLDPVVLRAALQYGLETSDNRWSTSWNIGKVVFVNDVYFCAQHIFRLAKLDGDIVCGLDFVRTMSGLSKEDQRLLMVKDLTTNFSFPVGIANFVSHWYWLLKQWRRYLGKRSYVLQSIPLIFYDKWVAHDINGKQFLNYPPYVSDEYGAQRLKDGFPFQAQCCWNGLVVLSAEPFKRGIQFRSHEPGECAGSECLLMCHDFFRLGYTNVTVDPGVRVAYTYDDAIVVYSEDFVRKIGFISWDKTDVMPITQPFLAPELVECCELQEGKEIVDFEHGCHDFNVYSKNFTELHLKSLGRGNDS